MTRQAGRSPAAAAMPRGFSGSRDMMGCPCRPALLATLAVMAVVALLVFSLLPLAAGDPRAIIAGDQAIPVGIARILS